MKAAICCVVLAVVLMVSAQTSNESQEQKLADIMCQLFLGDIPRCPASSCKEVADTKLWRARSGHHWLVRNAQTFQAYCTPSISPSESQGWMRVAGVSASQGCPSGLEPVTAEGRKMCRKTVNTGCSSVTFPTHGFSYSEVCGRVYGYITGTTDGFYRHDNCPDCTIEKQYVDGVSITHGHPRQHIWSLAAASSHDDRYDHHEYYCPCTTSANEYTYRPPFVGNDYSCEYEGTNTYSHADRLWDGQGCVASLQRCCDRGSWFCKQLYQPTTDDIEFRLCADEPPDNEDVYIEYIQLYVQ